MSQGKAPGARIVWKPMNFSHTSWQLHGLHSGLHSKPVVMFILLFLCLNNIVLKIICRNYSKELVVETWCRKSQKQFRFSYTPPPGTFPGRQPRGTSVIRHGDKPKIRFVGSKLTSLNRPVFELSFPLFIASDDLRNPSKPLLHLPRPLVK